MSDVQTKIGLGVGVSGARIAVQEIGSVYRELRAGTMTVKEGNAVLREYGASIRTQRRAISLLKAEYRSQNAVMLESMRAMRSVASIGRTITSTYQTYTLMQTRVADKTRDVRDTEADLAKVQTQRERIVRDLGANNALAMRLMDEEERLTKRLSEEKRELSQAQSQNIAGYAGMALELLGIIPKLGYMNQAITTAKGLLGEEWEYTGLKNLVSTAASAEIAILGVKASLGSLALAAAAPITATVVVNYLKGTDYWTEPEEGALPPTYGGAGFDVAAWARDMWMTFAGEKEPGFGGGEGYGGGGGGVRGDTNITTEGEDVDVEVDVKVTTKSKAWGGGDRRLR